MNEWLGLPTCSDKQWHRIIERLEQHVTELAEWSSSRVRQMIVQRGDAKKWVASFDGFYLTRGHYSNNASATIHDFKSSDIMWFTHHTKRGPGHNWEGTSGGAEGDMLDELMGKVKDSGFSIKEIITDKDSSTNAIFCRHFPEGRHPSNVTHPSLVSCLSKLPTRSPKKQMNAWIEQKRTFQRTTALIKSLGKPTITKPQAKRLDDLGFTYEDLVKLRSKHKDREVFQQVLKDKGVNSKPKLSKFLRP